MYQTRATLFHQLSKHLKFRQKYSAVHHIFNSLLVVWISWWNTVAHVWYTTSCMVSCNRCYKLLWLSLATLGLKWRWSRSYIHWPVNASLEHPCPGGWSCITWIHGRQVHSFGVEFFLHQVQFFIEELVHFHCFLVDCAPDSLQTGINGKVIN